MKFSRQTLVMVYLVSCLQLLWLQVAPTAADSGYGYTPTVEDRTTPVSPPFVPDLNFNKSSDRVLTFGKRSTVDGRLTISGCGTDMCFKLIMPELLEDDNLPLALTSGRILSFSTPNDKVPRSEFHASSVNFSSSSAAICDAFPATPLARRYAVSDVQNPDRCSGNTANDCYDVSVILVLSKGTDSEIWSRKVLVEVENPKSRYASVKNVTPMGQPEKSPVTAQLDPGATFPGDFMETPNVSGDGRLILMSGGQGGLVYAVNTGGQYDPCDARGWLRFHPISHMYNDPDMAPYGIAEYPFRDTEGDPYVDGDILRGSYPWLDRSGNSVFYSRVGSVNPDSAVGGYEFSVKPALGFLTPEYVLDSVLAVNNQAGLSFAGLWSRGKLIHLDGRANLSSYTININALDKDVNKDYCADPNSTDCILAKTDAANVRSQGLTVSTYSNQPPTTINEARNTQIFANEHHFNYLPYMNTIDPRDVTWILNTSRNTMELAFDDFVSPHVLIHSSMVPTISTVSKSLGAQNVPFFNDGFRIVCDAPCADELRDRYVADYSLVPRIQNSATVSPKMLATNLVPPAHGALLGGARVEPIAAGGFKGRGVYLDGVDDRIRYDVTSDDQVVEDIPWFISLWLNTKGLIDANGNPVQRELLHFPDSTVVQLKKFDRMRIKNGSFVKVIGFPSGLHMFPSRWTHLAIQSIPIANDTGTRVRIFVNGYAIYEGDHAVRLFRMTNGSVRLGFNPNRAGSLGFRGWIDDFKIIQGDLNPEEVCNHAYGTLVGVDPVIHNSNKSSKYPAFAHAAVTNFISADEPTFPQYFCEVTFPETDALSGALPGDYGTKVCLGALDNTEPDRCVGRSVLMPEGPLFYDLPRPDSRANTFCLSCHTDQDQRSTMEPEQVLGPHSETAEIDDRRQPTQPPQKIFGVLPGIFVGHPNAVPGAGEHPVDRLVLPSVND